MNTTLEDMVETVVKDFMTDEKAFTALDISNAVREKMPGIRVGHREVRDIVRNLWSTVITPQYDKSRITVTLADGSSADAQCYHPVWAMWDLDNIYNAQQWQQTTQLPKNNSTAPLVIPTVNGTLTKTSDGSVVVTTSKQQQVVSSDPKDLWNNMWKSQPSLFPRR